MKLKTLVVSIVILAVLSAAAYWGNRPSAPAVTDSRIGKTLVDSSAIEKAAKLRLSDQGKTVVLARQADGSWRDESYYDMPVDFSKLSTFVSDLSAAKIQRLVTTSPERLARLEFKDTKIELLDSADHPLFTLFLGKNADTGGRFVRYEEEHKAYLASLNAWLDSDPKNWADAQLLNVKADDVAKVEVPFDQAPAVTVSRPKKDGAWTAASTPAGQQVKADKVSSLLTSLGTIRFSDTTDSGDAQAAIAKQHLRVFRLTTFDGRTFTIALGRKPEEKKLKPVEKKPEPAAAPAPAAAGVQPPADAKSAADAKPAVPEKPAEPEYDTVPAGPVYTWITSSDARAGVNALMQKRSFQVDDYTFTGLPQKPDELFEQAPPPQPTPAKAPAAMAN
jgi:hypothetical protein